MQVGVERRRCVERVVDTHTSPARVACLFNARPVEQLCAFCDHCFDEGGRQEGSKVKRIESVDGVYLGCWIGSQDQTYVPNGCRPSQLGGRM